MTVLGSAASIQPGEFIQASGRWDNHREHGIQFKTTFLKVMPPSSLDGIEKYLGSGMIKGIGPHFAKKLVKAFGEEVFDVIETAPERLRKLDGIGPKRVERITSGWADQKAIREIMVFLQSHGVGTSRAVRIYKTYGADAIPLVSENPYRLARDIKGIGFLTADQIAEKLGIEKTAMIRARAGISYTLTEAVSEGHCGLPEDDLMSMAEKLLEIPGEILRDALQQELQDETVVTDTIGERRCIFLGHLWNAEKVIAERLKVLATGRPSWPEIDTEKAIPWVEQKLGVTLAESQREAVKVAVSSKVMVITGGPGVGKTTLVNAILRILVVKGVSGRDLGPRVLEHPFEEDGRPHPACRPRRDRLPRPAAVRADRSGAGGRKTLRKRSMATTGGASPGRPSSCNRSPLRAMAPCTRGLSSRHLSTMASACSGSPAASSVRARGKWAMVRRGPRSMARR